MILLWQAGKFFAALGDFFATPDVPDSLVVIDSHSHGISGPYFYGYPLSSRDSIAYSC